MTPHRILRTLAGALATAALVATVSVAHAATAEPSGLEPELAAKVAREKLKQTQRGAQAGGRNGGSGDGGACGQVDIGNDNPNDRSAARRLNERSKTVIVTGPVINAARCR